jgi:hypothetical protein
MHLVAALHVPGVHAHIGERAEERVGRETLKARAEKGSSVDGLASQLLGLVLDVGLCPTIGGTSSGEGR